MVRLAFRSCDSGEYEEGYFRAMMATFIRPRGGVDCGIDRHPTIPSTCDWTHASSFHCISTEF